jgi:tetratricopeptide (TPR) repeat protein
MVRPLVAAIVAVMTLAGAAGAAQDDPRLNPLFERLKKPLPEAEAREIEGEVWQIWVEHKDPEIERLMRDGIVALAQDDASTALDAFKEVVRLDKGFAEGWNKLATVEYVIGKYDESVADIDRTLALEPRHFGALSGLGLIWLAKDRKAEALKAFRAALAIDPNLEGLKERVDALAKEVEGSPI